MTTRAHLTQPIYTLDRNSLLTWASVRVYEADGVTLYTGKIYRGIDTTLTYPNPFVLAPALVDIWLDKPTRIVLGYTPDLAKLETLTPVLDVAQDADELITTAQPLLVTGSMVANGLLRASVAGKAVWFQPGLSPHDHHGVAPGSTRLGPYEPVASRISGFAGSTSIGVGFPSQPDYFYSWDQLGRRTVQWRDLEGQQWSSWSNHQVGYTASDPTESSMFGHSAYALGRGSIAIGSSSNAAPGWYSPSVPAAIAVGHRSTATSGSISIGQITESPSSLAYDMGAAQHAISIGRGAESLLGESVSIGSYSSAALRGVALGFNAVGAEDDSAVLGAHGTLTLTPETISFDQRSLVAPGSLIANGAAQLGTPNSLLGFFGETPVSQATVGAHDVGSGIPALDSLIIALRSLGLFTSRTLPLLAYDAETLLGALRSGDHVPRWDDDASSLIVAPQGRAPTFNETSLIFNNRPSVVMTPSTALVTTDPYPATTNYLIVASHGGQGMAGAEALVSLEPEDGADPRESVFTAATGVRAPNTQWAATMSRYTRDGLDQTANKRAVLDGKPHVYRATLDGAWPPSELILGRRDGTISPGWNGSIAELIGVDSSWTEDELDSLATGLAFKYHITQDDSKLLNPATALLVAGQDTPGEIHVNIDNVFVSTVPTMVSGSVIIPSSITLPTLPTVALSPRCGHAYQGPVTGIWRLLSQLLHWVEVYVLPTPATALSSQYLLGRFPIDKQGNWTTGRKECGMGHKVARPVLLSGNAPISYLGNNLTAELDVQVRVSTVLGGVTTLECVVPLRPDKTWFATVRHAGAVVAELVTITGGVVLADSVRPIPPTTIGQDSANVADLALAALAFLSLAPSYHFRAQEILKRLRTIQGVDGSLNANVSVTFPAITSGATLTSSTALAGLAAARYKAVTQDPQFDVFAAKAATFLLTRVSPNGAPVSGPGAEEMLTSDAVLCYWLWRRLAFGQAADEVKGALGGVFWNPSLGRFNRSVTYQAASSTFSVDFIHDLWTDLWTTLYCDSLNDPRAVSIRAALSQFKLQGVTVPVPN